MVRTAVVVGAGSGARQRIVETLQAEARRLASESEAVQTAIHHLTGDTPGRFRDEPEDPKRGRPAEVVAIRPRHHHHHQISAAGRRRIAAAQRARWAKIRRGRRAA